MIILGDFDITLPLPTFHETLFGIGFIVLMLIAVAFFMARKLK
jgi:hypothetical protein